MNNWLILIIIFAFGASIGSFLNCLAYRLIKDEKNWLKKFLVGKSHCPLCKHELNWRDLTPIFSFAWLGGKCRYCKQKISWQYPVVEFVTGLVFVAIFIISETSFENLFGLGCNFDLKIWRDWLIAGMLIVVFLVDFKEMIIPDKVIFPIGLIVLFMNLILGFSWIEMLISALAVSGFFLIQYLISKGKWIGFGDVKFGLIIGVLFGYYGILALLLAYLIGGLTASVLLIGHKKGAKSQIAFGPFLVLGCFLVLLWGEEIWITYQKLLLLI